MNDIWDSESQFWSLSNGNKLLRIRANIFRNGSDDFFHFSLFHNMSSPSRSSRDNKDRSEKLSKYIIVVTYGFHIDDKH